MSDQGYPDHGGHEAVRATAMGQPDPTTLTTQNLLREIAHLRELLEAQAAGYVREFLAYRETHHAKHVDMLRLTELRFDEIDTRYQQRYDAQTQAVSAAFEAQQTAMQSALAAADRSLTTALASADLADIRAEKLAEKRHELVLEHGVAIGELRAHGEKLAGRVDGLDRLTDAKFVTLRTLMDSQAEKVALALAASEKAVSKAETANEKRFEGVNEFRAQLSDQANTFIPRAEARALLDAISSRLDESIKNSASQLADLKEYRAGNQATSAAGRQSIAYIFTAIAALTGFVGIALAVLANSH